MSCAVIHPTHHHCTALQGLACSLCLCKAARLLWTCPCRTRTPATRRAKPPWHHQRSTLRLCSQSLSRPPSTNPTLICITASAAVTSAHVRTACVCMACSLPEDDVAVRQHWQYMRECSSVVSQLPEFRSRPCLSALCLSALCMCLQLLSSGTTPWRRLLLPTLRAASGGMTLPTLGWAKTCMPTQWTTTKHSSSWMA